VAAARPHISLLEEFFEVRLSGWPLAYKHLETRLLDELVSSVGLVVTVLLVLLFVALRDSRLWLASVVANAAPVVIVFGTLGLTGFGFGTALLLIPGLALGLSVDDTIHTGLSLRRCSSREPDALAGALSETRRPLLLTSAVLVLFSVVLQGSDVAMNRAMGAMLGPILIPAWLADAVRLPSLLTRASKSG
jgi:hypothetical protein